MAVSTTISPIAPYTNVSSIPFTITFGVDVETIVATDLVVTGGQILLFTKNSPSSYSGIFSPSGQLVSFSIEVPEGITESIVVFPDIAEPNSAQSVSSSFMSIGPSVTFTHSMYPIVFTNLQTVDVTFSHPVVALTASDFDLTNCSVHSITGSGSEYVVELLITSSGEFSFTTKENSILDIYGNYSRESIEIFRSYESSEDTVEKERTLSRTGSSFGSGSNSSDNEILSVIDLGSIRQVSQIQSLADCAKNLPQRLMEIAQKKLMDLIMNTEEAKKIASMVEVLQQKMELVESIRERIDAIRENPASLISEVLASRGLTGAALTARTQALIDKYGDATGVNAAFAAIDSLGICGQQNTTADGTSVSLEMKTPTDSIPPTVNGVTPVQFNTHTGESKDVYHAFTDRLKENYAHSNSGDAEFTKMIGVVTSLAMGFHDKVSKTTDSSKDNEYYQQYTAAVEAEKARNPNWTENTKTEFSNRTTNAGRTILTDTSIIRGFHNRNAPMAAGQLLSVGVTTYSGPESDYTTYLDIKPEQRPAALTAKYQAEGKRIPTGNTYTNSKGKTFKIGTLDYADAFRGAYGAISSDRTVASTRVPGGSIVQLRNKDGSIYDPTGKNPSGMYTVMDTGNAELTYKKPDIFTSTPNLYTNTAQVHVYLVSSGTKTGKQYNIAQQRYGGKSVA